MSRTAPRLTCGDFGGRNAQGEPCGVASVDGPCHSHREQVAERISTIMNPGATFRVPPFQRTKDKVAIVGFTSHRNLALELGDDFEIWGLNELYRYMPVARFHRWFEVHGREYLEQDDDGRQHMQDLKSLSIPIYMQKAHTDIPCSVRFPAEELCEQLGSRYFTNCPAWMLGMAIAMGFTEIHMYGVDMAQDTEYSVQRPCCEYWLGRAHGMGVTTFVPDMSDLLKCIGLYGYEDEGNVLSRKLQERLEWLHEQDNDRLALLRKLEAEYQSKHATLNDDILRVEGALQEVTARKPRTEVVKKRMAELESGLAERRTLLTRLDAEYRDKHHKLRDERNQIVGGIQNTAYLQRSWLVQAERTTGGGNIPSRDTRAADPRIGMLPTSPSGDSVPVGVPG